MTLARALMHLRRAARPEAPPPVSPEAAATLARRLDTAAQARLGRSLALRHVDAGGCGGCVLEVAALRNPVYELERFGLRFVSSPRHADVLLVTGPVARNMAEALGRTHLAMPDPKWVVAVGDCAADGGVFAGGAATLNGAADLLPVDLIVRGNPPSPADILSGLLTLLAAHAA